MDNDFKNYILNSFDRICDLSPDKLRKLDSLLDRIYGSYYDVKSFKEEFGLEKAGFITIYNFMIKEENILKIQQFGKKCFDNALSVSNKHLS